MNYVDPKKPDLAYDAPLMIAGAPPKATTNTHHTSYVLNKHTQPLAGSCAHSLIRS